MDIDAFLSSPLPMVIGVTIILVVIGFALALLDMRRFDREEQARAERAQREHRPPPRP